MTFPGKKSGVNEKLKSARGKTSKMAVLTILIHPVMSNNFFVLGAILRSQSAEQFQH